MKKSFTKVLSVMLSLVMCMSAIAVVFTSSAVAAECTHENSKYYGYQEPTCLVPGGDMYRCEDCKEIYALNVVPKTDHIPGPAATCTSDQVCTTEGCGYVFVVGGHTYNKDKNGVEIIYTAKADCSTGADTYQYKLCSVCGHEEVVNTTPGSGKHNMVANEAEVIAPTCDQPGTMPYYCANGCGHTENVVIRPLGHNVVYVAKVAETCTTDGMEAHWYCGACDSYFTDAAATVKTTKAALAIPAAHTAGYYLDIKQHGSCTVDEIETWHCGACNAYYEVNKGKVHDPATHTTPPTCIKYGYTYLMCQLCGTVDESSTKLLDPLGHDIAPTDNGTYYPATCTEGAYTLYTCLRVGCETSGIVKVMDEKNPALGHKFYVAVEAVAPTCTAPGSTAVIGCENPGCLFSKGGDPVAQLDHDYQEKKYDKTCTTYGYTIIECTTCGGVKPGAVEKNIEPADGVSHVMDVEITTTPTCTKTGVETTYCIYCDKVDVMKEIPATGHDWKDEPFDVYAGTCVDRAYEAFECENCTEVNYVYGDYNTTPAGHEEAMGHEGAVNTNKGVNGVLREGTCQIRELVCFNCSACNHEYEKNTEYGSANHTLVPHPGQAPDCTTETNGWEDDGWYCVQCTAANTAAGKNEIVWNIVPTTIPYAHNDVTPHAEYLNSCFNAGWSAFNSCTVCDAAGNGKHSFAVLSTTTYKLAQLQHVGTDVVVPAVAAECETDGNIAYRYCSVCKFYFAKDLVDAKKSAKDNSNLTLISNDYDADIKLPATGHAYSNEPKVFATPKTCDQMSYTYHECSKCHDKYIDQFVNVKAHTWVVDSVVAPTCLEDGYTTYNCSACPATGKNLKDGDHKEALGHKNAKGEIFWGYCYETITDRKCVRECDCDGNGNTACDFDYNETNEIHDYIYTKHVYPTCEEYGYDMILCANCESKQITTYYPATGHAATGTLVTKECVEPTYTTTGLKVWICGHIDQNTGKACGEHITEVLPVLTGLNITIDADSAIYSGADLVNGGKVQFTVALETIDVMATSLLTTFTYDNTILTFDKAEIADVFGEGTINDAYANDKTGTLIISSYASYTEEGKVQDKKITGQAAYAVLTFNINKNAIGKNAVLTATDIEILNIKDEEPVAPITDKNAVSNEAVVIKELGNVNGDMAINTIDTMAIRKIFSNELLEAGKPVLYKATADVDMDGDVDLEDFARLNKYLIGAISYEQLVLNK